MNVMPANGSGFAGPMTGYSGHPVIGGVGYDGPPGLLRSSRAMTERQAMRQGLKTAALALGLLAAWVLMAAPEPALAKGKPTVHKRPLKGMSAAKTKSGNRQHCGLRGFSVSVGNPAFKDRLAAWPGPCRW